MDGSPKPAVSIEDLFNEVHTVEFDFLGRTATVELALPDAETLRTINQDALKLAQAAEGGIDESAVDFHVTVVSACTGHDADFATRLLAASGGPLGPVYRTAARLVGLAGVSDDEAEDIANPS